VSLLYQPSPWQKLYHDSTVNELLGAGAAGPGKTRCLIAEPLQQIRVEHARCAGDPRQVTRDEQSELFRLVDENRLQWGYSTGWALYLRRTTPMLLESLVHAKRLFTSVDQNVRFDADHNIFTFSSGFRVQYGHCAERDDWERYQGIAFSLICWDELTQFEREQYDQINSRLRSSDPVLVHMLKIRAMSNPMMRRTHRDNFHISDPHWVRKQFVDPAPQGKVILKTTIALSDGSKRDWTRMYLPALLSDNPDKAFVADYEFRLLKQPPHIRNALLKGDWYGSPDSFFGESWDKRIHTCRPFRIPPEWPQVRTMDWGHKHPGCVLWAALDPDNTLWVHKELTFKGKDAKQVADMIRQIEQDLGLWDYKRNKSGITGPADTQLWEDRGDRSLTKAAEMAKVGVGWRPASKRSRARNAQHLTARLRDHGDGEVPGIVFFDGCRWAIRTIPAIQTDVNDPESPAEGGEDHHYDAVSYLCAFCSKPVGSARRRPSAPDEDFDDEPVEQHDRGRFSYGSNLC
jgi:hypothetical protein